MYANVRDVKICQANLNTDFDALEQNANAFHVLRREISRLDVNLNLCPNFDLADLFKQLPDDVVINFCATAPRTNLVPVDTLLSLRKPQPIHAESYAKDG